MSKYKKIVLAGLLLGTLIVASRFLSVKTPIVVISFSFVPIMLSAVILGPKWSALIAGLGDLIGALLFPFGPYFVGYTISAALTGFIYGLFLYKKEEQEISDEKFLFKIIISSVIVLTFITIGLTTIWVYITSGKAISIIIPTRATTALIMLPVQVMIMYVLEKALRKPIDKFLRD